MRLMRIFASLACSLPLLWGSPSLADESVLNKEGFWRVQVGDTGETCAADGLASEHLAIRFLAALGGVGLWLDSDAPLRKGRVGRVETDAGQFKFKVGFAGERALYSDDPFDRADVLALRRAKSFKVSIDSRVLVDMNVEATGFAEMLDAVVDCSLGEAGWWGEGAKSKDVPTVR